MQLAPFRAARSLDGHPTHHCDDVARQRLRVGVLRQIAIRERALKSLADCLPEPRSAVARFPPQRVAFVGTDERSMHHQTSGRVRRIAVEVSGPAQQPFGDFARCRKVERYGKKFRRSFVVAVQNRTEQLLLIAESGVEARPANAESLVRSEIDVPS